MGAFIPTFEAVAMLLVIGMIGFWMVSRRMVDEDFFSLLSPLALEVALPALIFVNIIENFNPATKPGWWKLPLWWLIFVVIAFSVSLIGMMVSREKNRREFGMTLFYQNGLFFPLAIITGIFGSESGYTVDLFFMMMFYAAFFFNTYHFFFRKRSREVQWDKIFHPVFIMTVLAIMVKITGAHPYIPSFVISGLRMVGDMSVPLLMIILGGNMLVDFKGIGKLRFSEMFKFISFKNILIPSVILLFLCWIRPSFNVALIFTWKRLYHPLRQLPSLPGEKEGTEKLLINI